MASVRADQAVVDLQEITKLLQLIFHRNKNQHHLAKWWKWFAMLKRCLLKLSHEKAEAVKARVTYMSEFLIPRCHRAFTNLVADQQFAALGLVLLANLAKVGLIVGAMAGKGPRTPARDARHASATSEASEDLGVSVIRSDPRVAALSLQSEAVRHHHATTADGNGLRREKDMITSSNARSISEPIVNSPSSSPRPRKRRRGKANAIDELFDGVT